MCSTRHALREDTDWTECFETSCGSKWKRATLARERPLGEVQRFRRRQSTFAGSSGTCCDFGEKAIHFVAHVVPGNSGLLLGRSDLEALGVTIGLRTDHLHVTLKLSTTPAGHHEIDLVSGHGEAAIADVSATVPGSTEGFGEQRRYIPCFSRKTSQPPHVCNFFGPEASRGNGKTWIAARYALVAAFLS